MAINIRSDCNLMDGSWKTSIVTPLEDRNPADPNEIIGLFTMATLDDTKSAVQAARSAFAVRSRIPDKANQNFASRLDDIAAAHTHEDG